MLKKLTLIGFSLFILGAHAEPASENNDKKDKYDEWCEKLDRDQEQLEKIEHSLDCILNDRVLPNDLDEDMVLKKTIEQIRCLAQLDFLYVLSDDQLKNETISTDEKKLILEIEKNSVSKCCRCVTMKLQEKKNAIKK